VTAYGLDYGTVVEALADGTRRAIVERLREGERSVGELATELPVSRPAVSQHLAVLKRAGVVADRRDGTRRIYRLEPAGFETLRRYVEDVWERALARFAETVEREEHAMEMTAIEPVRRSVTVRASRERAFGAFTERFGEWWPLELHSISVDDPEEGGKPEIPQTAILEGGQGGRVFERLADGRELDWGSVTAWDPPARLVIAWNPSRQARPSTEIEVTFERIGDEETRVDVEHRGWEGLGPRAADVREGYAEGWELVLGRFARNAETG
jgi:DNA-binding transcriptional ArsR family regulator/uncharacterized protein YndB with AHSA1/START domain